MPGIDAKSLIKAPPMDFAGLLAANSSNVKPGRRSKIPNYTPSTSLNPRAEMNTFNRRHGPDGEMMVASGLYDMDSRLLGEEDLKHPKLAEALKRAHPNAIDGHLRLHVTGGGRVLQANNETSVLPAWRKAFVHVLGAGGATGNVDSMRELAPNMGAYVNEVNKSQLILMTLSLQLQAWIKQPNWKNDFWGSNYPRLSEIKTKWDPNMVFYVTPGINADLMYVKDGRMCLVQGKPTELPSDIPPIGDNENIAVRARDAVSFPYLYAGPGKPPVWGLPYPQIPSATASPVPLSTSKSA
jgi:hypothetical protein